MSKALVLGIAGGSASGKSTLAAAIAEDLNVSGLSVRSFCLDAYFHTELERSPRVTLPNGEVWFDRNHPDSADTGRLKDDIGASLDERDVVLVEGHLVLALEGVRRLMDVKVFVDLEDDARALRRMLRDMSGGRGKTDPAFIAEYYLACAKRGHDLYVEPSRRYADFVLRGDADIARTVRLLAATVNGLMRTGRAS